jgi:DNA-binding protein HU-beta
MQKTELIAQVAKDAGVSQAEAGKVVNSVLTAITNALKKGEKVTLTGIGTFEVRKTAAHTGTNPRTGKRSRSLLASDRHSAPARRYARPLPAREVAQDPRPKVPHEDNHNRRDARRSRVHPGQISLFCTA